MNLQQDKQIHFWAGFIICLFIGLIFSSDGTWTNHVTRGIIVGASCGLGATLAKDLIWDLLLKRGTFDWKDILAGTIGTACGSFLLSLLFFVN